MDSRETKRTVPYPSVGAGGEQPNSQICTTDSISEAATENNPQDESMEDILRELQRTSDPAYLHTVSMNELYRNVYQSRPPIIDGLLYPGTYLFAGAPKVGKSFLMAQLAYHVSMGLPLWGYPVHKGTVLYLALEDDHRRLQGRLYRKCFCVTFAESNKGRRWRGERSVDLKRTISAMVGQGSVNHNSRAFNAKNTDRSRSHLNITYCHENIKTVFHELFDEALKRYNDKQTRADRKIEDYYEKIRSSKQEKPFHEIILQVGNKDDMSAEGEDGQLAAAVLDEYMRGFQERNPQLRVFSAHLHMDEATPHLHIDFVPFTTGSKRGLDTRVSLKQALAAQGFKGGTRGDTEWSQWVRSEKEQLAAVMERHGIEWEDKGTHDKHLSVMDYKKEQRAKEIAELEAVKAKKQGQVERQEQRLKELAPAVRNMEQLAAQFSDDPERILPEPGPLESAKSYREKKAKPLLAQIVKVLRSLYRAYVELKRKYERLQGDYGRAREGNERLSDRLQETKLENKALRGAVADFERVKRAFGPEEVERAVEDAKRREAQEREQKKAKRRFRRGAR